MHYDRDYALAQQLQEQYNRDAYNESNNPKTPVKVKQKIEHLSSPSWELTDPNPNVHALFMQFDRQFFWSSLSSVAVRWSKRMYSCAGICRYQARGGFCDIALSEPLLKLRPRKDMVQTLLHEMIHAYLFVTKSNRDRDGHGPDFHEHMYRINSAANLNITVYHSFIEETKFYLTHWWRCNGPCQKVQPYFGMIRRSSNRAPAPTDYWWPRHQQTCGGQFIKIKEPEKTKKTLGKESKPPSKIVDKDIRQYLKVPKKSFNLPSASKGVIEINNFPTIPNITAKVNPLQNDGIKSKENLKTINNESSIMNTDKIIKVPASREYKSSDVLDTVRNHWSLKYSDKKKRTSDDDISSANPCKIFKSTDLFKTDALKNGETSNPPLKISMPIDKFNDCKKILYDVYGESVITDSVLSKLCDTDNLTASQKDDSSLSTCPICDASIIKKNINSHLDRCVLTKEFIDNDFQDEPSAIIDLTWENEFKTPFKIPENVIINLTDDAEETKPLEKFHNCPICNILINTNITEDHLEECLSRTFQNESNEMSSSSEDNNLSDDFDESQQYNATGSKIPCPCCYTLIEVSEMNDHLDDCLI